jgi:hypothetical protein
MIPNRSALFALAALALPAGAQAQQVSADISIGGGPVAGRIIVGDPYYRHPVYREIVVVHAHRGRGWYSNHGYRPVQVYYDSYHNRYYDRPYYGGLRLVVVYRDGGRYYQDGDWRDASHRGGYGRDGYQRDEYRNDYRRRVADRSDRWRDGDGRR